MRTRIDKRRGGSKKGITLLIALLTMNILLAVGLSISNLSYKSLRLSSFGEDSQFAYYAAEAGFECAEYWDKKGAFDNPPSPTPVSCNGETLAVIQSGNVYTFTVPFLDMTYCADLSVQKPGGGNTHTIIEARGYNACEPARQRVERGIRATK